MFELGIILGAAGMLALVALLALVDTIIIRMHTWLRNRRGSSPPQTLQPRGLELIDMEVRPWS